MGPTILCELIESYNSNTLWDMARAAQLPGTSGKKLKKAPLQTLMGEEFFKSARIAAAYKKLTALEKTVLNRLQLRGSGIVSTRAFRRELMRAKIATEAPQKEIPKDRYYYRATNIYGRVVNHIGTPTDPQSTIFEDIIARLTKQGLVFSQTSSMTSGGTPPKMQFHPDEKIFIPTIVLNQLPEATPLTNDSTTWEPDRIQQGHPQQLLRELYLYWDAVRQNDITMLKSGLVSKRALKMLNEALMTPDEGLKSASREDELTRLYFLRLLAQGLNLLKLQAGQLQPIGKGASSFWQQSTQQQVKKCLDVWVKLNVVNTLPRGAQEYRPQYQQAHHMLLKNLRGMPQNAWMEREDFLILLQDENVDFLFSGRGRIESNNSRGWYSGHYYYGDPKEILQKMNQYEAQFVEKTVAGFLAELGLVELGFEKGKDSWFAFRLSELGQAIYHGKGLKTAVSTSQIVLQPNFQILAIGPVPMHLLAQLDSFATRLAVDPTVFSYQLSRESIYAGQQVGVSVADVVNFLESHTENELPQNVQRSLAEWGADHDRIVFRQGITILQAANGELLQQLLADKVVGKHLSRSFSPEVALVKPKQQGKLVEKLQMQGLLPAVSGANPEAADKSVVVAENGRIEAIHAVPSLHLQGRLDRFSESAGTGWQLTEKSVSRAGGSKNKVLAIVEELGKLHRGQLPKTLNDQIRAWGGYYGEAKVGTYTLIEFRDKALLKELVKRSDLKDLLQVFPAGDRALSLVREGELGEVTAVLEKLGVKIKPVATL